MATYDDITNLALRRSIFYPACEIYPDTPAGLWHYGPYGAAIKRRIIEFWRKNLVQKEGMLEIDASEIMPAAVFEASGHLSNLVDPVVVCAKCKASYRADKIIEEASGEHVEEGLSEAQFDELLARYKVVCKKCKIPLTGTTKSSLMVKTLLRGGKETYLRPETCQSIFMDFDRMAKTMRIKLPAGIAQVGKSFRNEISPRQAVTRAVEFTQEEAEIFFDPAKIDEIEGFDSVADYKIRMLILGKDKEEMITAKDLAAKKLVPGKLIAYYLARVQQLYEGYGFKLENMRFREVSKEDRAFYSGGTWDFEVNTSLGWLELIANNYRMDHDLKTHSAGAKKELRFSDEEGKVQPHVYEISIGCDRTLFAMIDNAFRQEGERVFLSLKPEFAPYLAGVLPLLSNKPDLVKKAKGVYEKLADSFDIFYDQAGSIGKRYARLDEIGVPFCITIDFDTLNDDTVTLRERDSQKQERVKVSELKKILGKLIRQV